MPGWNRISSMPLISKQKPTFITRGITYEVNFDNCRAASSASALAQNAPKVGNEPWRQVRPKAPVGCKPLGTVGGTRLWAGDCAEALARAPRRNEAREPIDARPAEEKSWWGR